MKNLVIMKNLVVKWTISKGRDTYGWNIVTLIDGKDKYKTNGGGYDMMGTVFAQWLWKNYSDKIIETIKDRKEKFYGFHQSNVDKDKY